MKTLALVLLLADLRSDVLSKPGYVAYFVPTDGVHHVCWGSVGTPYVVYQVENGRIIDIRLSAPECGEFKNVQMLTNVDGKESVRLLRGLVDGDRSIAKKAVNVLALHRDFPDEDLIALARKHPSTSVRSGAVFWVSQRAGVKAGATLRDALDNDPDAEVRKKALFAISQLPDDRSVPLLIDLMKTHKSREVRKKAAFWLGQKDDPRALQALEEVLLH